MIYIGTSGWYYKHWEDVFYPSDIKTKEYLKYYSKYFSTVEVNSSFYHLLKEYSVENWVNTVSDDFIFSVKASRFISHVKRLKDPEKSLALFIESIKPLKGKLGPILVQLPPKFNFNASRLNAFIQALPLEFRYAFEFRDKSWFNTETYEILKSNNLGFCIYYMGNYQSPLVITTDFVYFRFHGPIALGCGEYSEDKLEEFCQIIIEIDKHGKDVFAYFNNDEAGYAVKNAQRLIQKINAKSKVE